MWVVQTNYCQALKEHFQEGCRLWAGKCAIPNSTRSHMQCCYVPHALQRYPKTLRLSAEIIQHFNIRYPHCPVTQESSSRAVQIRLWGSTKTCLYFLACSAWVVEQESSCVWPCAQWAGAGGADSSHMEELKQEVSLILTPTDEHVF